MLRPVSDVPIMLHSKQVEFIRSDATLRGYVGGRGAGKSFIGTYDLYRRARAGRFYMFASPTYPQLRDTSLRTFKELGHKLDRIESINHTDKFARIKTLDGGIADVSFRSTEDPESLRGPNMSGIWLDEASLMKDEAFDIAIGCLREGGQLGSLWATFTPKGKRHWTYKAFASPGAVSTQLVHSSTYDNPFLPESFAPMMRGRYSVDKQIQELGGQFIDLDGQLISYESMMGCTDAYTLWAQERPAQGLLYVGWDLGRSRNLSVIWTWERLGDVAWCRECHVMRNVPYDLQEVEFRKRISRKNVTKIIIDKGFVGGVYAERYAKLLGSHRVEGVALSGGMQGHLAETMANAFDKRLVRIPDSDEIRDDFSLVGKTTNRSGKVYLDAASVQEDDELGHADRFWAAALAYKGIHDSANTVQSRPFTPRLIKRY